VRTQVPSPRFGTFAKGLQATLGIRPHDIHVAKEGREVSCTLHVEFVEALGFEAYIHGTTEGGAKLVVRLDAEDGRRARTGDKVPLSFDPGHIHLFDKKTEIALDDKGAE
jgi:multiple sugar transport system ATP-binding protein